jgi:8-oxo-dGTP pyrophosphatase MutT (NUDIX family)
MTSSHLTTDTRPLVFGDAAAAILRDAQGRYLLQLRDDIPGIWYPGHWGLFGGAIEAGESAPQALARELEEEVALRLDPRRLAFFMRYVFELDGLAGERRWRHVFAATLDTAEIATLRLGEGADLGWFAGGEALERLRLIPYDSFALFLHARRERIG